MAEREVVYSSSEILGLTLDNGVKNNIELQHLREYTSLYHDYSHSKFLVEHYKKQISNTQQLLAETKRIDFIEIRKKAIAKYEIEMQAELDALKLLQKQLESLEKTKPIQDILNRAKQNGATFTMEFAPLSSPNDTNKTPNRLFAFFKPIIHSPPFKVIMIILFFVLLPCVAILGVWFLEQLMEQNAFVGLALIILGANVISWFASYKWGASKMLFWLGLSITIGFGIMCLSFFSSLS